MTARTQTRASEVPSGKPNADSPTEREYDYTNCGQTNAVENDIGTRPGTGQAERHEGTVCSLAPLLLQLPDVNLGKECEARYAPTETCDGDACPVASFPTRGVTRRGDVQCDDDRTPLIASGDNLLWPGYPNNGEGQDAMEANIAPTSREGRPHPGELHARDVTVRMVADKNTRRPQAEQIALTCDETAATRVATSELSAARARHALRRSAIMARWRAPLTCATEPAMVILMLLVAKLPSTAPTTLETTRMRSYAPQHPEDTSKAGWGMTSVTNGAAGTDATAYAAMMKWGLGTHAADDRDHPRTAMVQCEMARCAARASTASCTTPLSRPTSTPPPLRSRYYSCEMEN